MLPLYFLVQILALLCGWPFLLLLRLRRPEKFKRLRGRLYGRLGERFGSVRDVALTDFVPPPVRPRIWLHALSVGEVSSALPLARAIREHFPNAFLVVTVTTESGETFAKEALARTADLILAAPIDWLPSVWHFLDHLKPNLFIQVETDFWPGLLFSLRRRQIPALLVNGRISAASFNRYHRFRALFRPMFACFSTLAMQTEADRDKMIALGLPPGRLPVLGNLKYAAAPAPKRAPISNQAIAALVPPGRRLWVCGSTHPGEEEIIFAAYGQLRARIPDVFLLLAPRRPERGGELVKLASRYNLTANLRSRKFSRQGSGQFSDLSSHQDYPKDAVNSLVTDLLILDSIGELAACYFLADVAFIGGSLVHEGGHNPLEAAWAGKPVLIGPHMEDFSEIAAALIAAGAARAVSDTTELTAALVEIFTDATVSQKMGATALALVEARRQGVLAGHLAAIAELLTVK